MRIAAGLLCVLAASASAASRDYGVDVSHYQGSSGVPVTTWQSVKSSGKTFAYIKATEGLTGPDDGTMAANVSNATAAGMITGVYHYAHPANRPTVSGAVQEADHFYNYSSTAIAPGHLRPALDIEGNADTLTPAALSAWVLAFCNRVVQDAGNSSAMPIVYCDQYDASYAFDSSVSNLDSWIAGSGDSTATGNPYTTGMFSNWAVWQYSSSGTSGSLTSDVDVLHNEYKTLSSLLITVPEPAAVSLIALGLLVIHRGEGSRRGRNPERK